MVSYLPSVADNQTAGLACNYCKGSFFVLNIVAQELSIKTIAANIICVMCLFIKLINVPDCFLTDYKVLNCQTTIKLEEIH